ncbi:uncharacterized protein LOC132286746 [Cornus florida]|uniref:uncharacterized protein LOC132286746 n=1 Tax=Cornus florida TaxID=4283 RepID=UPI0028969265|nr:uncharacterized protein LOC132286746 [Cornus florida]XP_059645115.1 uncharacterized protein LOC132286746 [Cornus florida]
MVFLIFLSCIFSHIKSSKVGAKRGLRERNCIVAALRTSGNEGITISDRDSNSPHTQLGGQSRGSSCVPIDHDSGSTSANDASITPSTHKGPHKGRGPSILANAVVNDNESPLPIEFNERGQPIGENSKKNSTSIGIIARQNVPISSKKWKEASAEKERLIWTSIKQKFEVPDFHKKDAFRRMGKSWGDYRTRLTTNIYKSNEDTEAIDSLKPDSIQSIDEWQQFVSNRLSDDHKRKREKSQELRKKQKMPHTTSRKGYARLEDEMRKKSDAPDSITRVDVWIEGHMRKGGKPLNDATEEAVV